MNQDLPSQDAVQAAIPTRLSTEDDGIINCLKYDVYFNGAKQTRCCVADAKQGYVVRYVKMSMGIPQRDRNGHLRTERDYGKVVIVLRGAPLVDSVTDVVDKLAGPLE